jgi:hypothetical protein
MSIERHAVEELMKTLETIRSHGFSSPAQIKRAEDSLEQFRAMYRDNAAILCVIEHYLGESVWKYDR